LLVAAEDREALAAAMIRLASDPEEARRLADAAYDRASSTYAMDRVADEYRALYETVIAECGGARAAARRPGGARA
jgi:glycosyltransferase involved in cell wall biosynthesis